MGEYGTINGIFTADEAGYYQVNCVLRFGSFAWIAGEQIRMHGFYNNTTVTTRLDHHEFESNGSYISTLSGSELVYLGAGDTYRIQVYQDSGSSVDLSYSVSGGTSFSIYRVQ